MDGGIGALLLVTLVVVACIVGVFLLIAFVVGVSLIVVGAFAVCDRVGRSARLASEAELDDVW